MLEFSYNVGNSHSYSLRILCFLQPLEFLVLVPVPIQGIVNNFANTWSFLLKRFRTLSWLSALNDYVFSSECISV
jgi:hypothetical protein